MYSGWEDTCVISNMNKIYTLLICFLFSITLAGAQSVREDVARKVAEMFFLKNNPSSAGDSLDLAYSNGKIFIFNRAGGGFVAISADYIAKPVIGYSFSHIFDRKELSDNMKGWIDDISSQIERGRRNPLLQKVSAWDDALTLTRGTSALKSEVSHATAQWNQGEPFNRLCPVVDGERAVTGCGPLAISIIMQFYKWPAAGKGTLAGYSYYSEDGNTISVNGHTLGHKYSWDKMKIKYEAGSYSEDAADAVAQLVYDCGVMTKASYGRSTAVNLNNIPTAMNAYMDYDCGINYYYKGYFTDAQWTELIRQELQEHPIIYRGRNETVGHIFVLDGYDTEGRFSVNWGKGGNFNGYFDLNALVYNKTSYCFEQAAFFGLKPNAGGGQLRYLAFNNGTYQGINYTGLSLVSGAIGIGQPFVVQAGIRNCGNDQFNGQIVVAHTDSAGNIKEFISPFITFTALASRKWRGVPKIECTPQMPFVCGDKVLMFSRYEGEQEWTKILADKEQGCIGELVYCDGRPLSQVSYFAYVAKSRSITVTTRNSVTYTVTSSDGKIVEDGVTLNDGIITIDVSRLKTDTYTLEIKDGEETVRFKVKGGML